jgi:transposase
MGLFTGRTKDLLCLRRLLGYFCEAVLDCSHRIFTERLPGLVQSYGRMTTRLSALLQVLGLGTGGQLGMRLAERLGITTSPSSVLRSLMQFRAARVPAIRVLGVDDWSWKKGRRYGTG